MGGKDETTDPPFFTANLLPALFFKHLPHLMKYLILIWRTPPRPYGISYRSIIPKKGECENLFSPICLGASHVAHGSIRMEPVFMALSQSAAIAAGMAIDANLSVQDLPYPALLTKLEAAKQIARPETWRRVPPAKKKAPPAKKK
jgi:FAD dependent oxidoreductase